MCCSSGFVIFWTTKYHTPPCSFPDQVIKRLSKLLCLPTFPLKRWIPPLAVTPRTHILSVLSRSFVSLVRSAIVPPNAASYGVTLRAFLPNFPELSPLEYEDIGELILLGLTTNVAIDCRSTFTGLTSCYQCQATLFD